MNTVPEPPPEQRLRSKRPVGADVRARYSAGVYAGLCPMGNAAPTHRVRRREASEPRGGTA
ncbi:MAG: hypothetical protein FWC62_02875 [Firmicutes bacterium]|nr:hypothetical protein [Bacillota bacterium]